MRWRPPIGWDVEFTELSGNARISSGQIALSRFDGVLYSGLIKGAATIKWGGSLSAEGRFALEGADLGPLLQGLRAAFNASGTLDTSVTFASQGQKAAELFAAPRVNATFTLRMSYGDVHGWPEKGQQVEPFTKLARLYERTTGQDPFRLPQRWLDARSKLDPNTPFDYVTTHDIVGGNSGSPVVDAQGRLVGLAFDGNIHSIAGSYWYDERMNRAVAVHPAIIVTALRDVYGAKTIAAELLGGHE
jgi:hypothetical protein